MRGLVQQLQTSLRLYFRNRMALFYGYLFPTVFLLAFWVLYRYDRVPLIRHVGELLTVTILGGACFGLPTTLVGDRERGVWRRFRLTPVPTAAIVVSTVMARYAILISAGLLQLALAMALGMPAPRHPAELFVAFTFAAFAFLGLGLVIAMLADNVPAVQALGQSIFLPMLIVGGVAVPLSALPEWAQHLSAFFPGRYAVEAIQATANGDGLSATGYSLLALTTIGLAACVAGGRMFRWDSQQRFATTGSRGWLAVALAAWVAVGIGAEYRGYVKIFAPAETAATTSATVSAPTVQPEATTPASAPDAPAAGAPSPSVSSGSAPTTSTGALPASGVAAATAAAGPAPPTGRSSGPAPSAPSGAAPGAASSAAPSAGAAGPSDVVGPRDWRAVTMADVEREIAFERLPPDTGVVIPVAPDDREVDADTLPELGTLTSALEAWTPARVADPVQRVRNLIYVAAVIDVLQWPTESFVPHIILDRLQREFSRDDLVKLLFWVAYHADQGSVDAVSQMKALGIDNPPADTEEIRGRSGAYAAKFLGRVTGKRPGR